MKTVRVGLIGSQFVSGIHASALRMVPGAEVLAVASPTEQHARGFAATRGIPHWHTDYRKMLEMDELDMVAIGAPNDLHCQMTVDSAAAGKHVVCEKPLALNLAEADRMIEACRRAKVKLMYAEELCFAPKYVRLKKLAEEGAFGEISARTGARVTLPFPTPAARPIDLWRPPGNLVRDREGVRPQ